jgi:hypothetical protein
VRSCFFCRPKKTRLTPYIPHGTQAARALRGACETVDSIRVAAGLKTPEMLGRIALERIGSLWSGLSGTPQTAPDRAHRDFPLSSASTALSLQ